MPLLGSVNVGDELELEVGAVAHGGHCVARAEGQVVFVRHALPGERVRAKITESGPHERFLRADAVEVINASPARVQPPCPYAGPDRCGGCDWQHATLAEQRRLKSTVIAEQLRRLAGLERTVEVQALPGSPDGLGWRTRVQFAIDSGGHAGLRKHRSHEVVPVDRCLIAHPEVDGTGVTRRRWRGRYTVEVITGSTGPALVLVDGEREGPGRGRRAAVQESAAGRTWRVSESGFWQVHPAAADTLVDAVLRLLSPRPGEHALDLYCGVGLFAGALGDRLAPSGSVIAVESAPIAIADARRNLHDLPQVRPVGASVDPWTGGPGWGAAALVVLARRGRAPGSASSRELPVSDREPSRTSHAIRPPW